MKLTSEERRATILTAALRVAADHGLHHVTHGAVAKRCIVPTSERTVRAYFPVKHDIWRAVIAADTTGAAADQARGMGWTT